MLHSKDSLVLGEGETGEDVERAGTCTSSEQHRATHGADMLRCRWEAEAAFLLGTCMELVYTEAVINQKELLVGTVKGVLRAKVGQVASRAAPETGLVHCSLCSLKNTF